MIIIIVHSNNKMKHIYIYQFLSKSIEIKGVFAKAKTNNE